MLYVYSELKVFGGNGNQSATMIFWFWLKSNRIPIAKISNHPTLQELLDCPGLHPYPDVAARNSTLCCISLEVLLQLWYRIHAVMDTWWICSQTGGGWTLPFKPSWWCCNFLWIEEMDPKKFPRQRVFRYSFRFRSWKTVLRPYQLQDVVFWGISEYCSRGRNISGLLAGTQVDIWEEWWEKTQEPVEWWICLLSKNVALIPKIHMAIWLINSPQTESKQQEVKSRFATVPMY